jgi:flavin reductase (DIM6/NTAB) family NADH-FMN oxidoreductase RutF
MGHFATGVTVLTTAGENGHGMTANAFTSVSLEPPMVLCCVAFTARMHEAVVAAGGYAVSVLSSEQRDQAKYFADKKRPGGAEQFDAVDWVPGPATGAPLLSGALAWLECELAETYAGGDHSIFLGRVLAAGSGAAEQPLVFYQGRFHEPPGSVALPPARSA